MGNLWLKADALWRLGLRNVARVALYRSLLKIGLHPVQRVRRKISAGVFFRPIDSPRQHLESPGNVWDEVVYFGWYRPPISEEAPNWFLNTFTGAFVSGADSDWWTISDFETGAGDIKTVWEASRFDWVLTNAQRAACGEARSLERLNRWLGDWCEHNPSYRGPNWKCGQEASIRVLHLLLAARFLNQLDEPEPALITLIEAHLARIHPTLAYAMAQDNNHGTSEAAALFMGGAWLTRHSVNPASRWARTGRQWLETCVERLVEPDGGFSQYSINYHRLMLDTLGLAELWRKWFDLPAFSEAYYNRARAATRWLHAMTHPQTGDTPNLGANDGANLLPLTDADFRDYRPAVQLASLVFENNVAYLETGPHHAHIRWMELEKGATAGKLKHEPVFHAKGYMVLHRGPWKALLRYPYYRFRPSHCDALHIDLWHGRANLLRDAGSFGYHIEDELAHHFTGPTGHNTIQFDDRDPMPKLSRFLRGSWLKAKKVVAPRERNGVLFASASYRDSYGTYHSRNVALSAEGLRVVDQVDGFRKRAVLRWRLAPGRWQLLGHKASCRVLIDSDGAINQEYIIEISSDVKIRRLEIVNGWESRYYLKRESVPILEAEICEPGQLVSEYRVL